MTAGTPSAGRSRMPPRCAAQRAHLADPAEVFDTGREERQADSDHEARVEECGGRRPQHAMRADRAVEDAEGEEHAQDRHTANRRGRETLGADRAPEAQATQPARDIGPGHSEENVVAVVPVDGGHGDRNDEHHYAEKRECAEAGDACSRARCEGRDQQDAKQHDPEVERVGGGKRHHHDQRYPRDPCRRGHPIATGPFAAKWSARCRP